MAAILLGEYRNKNEGRHYPFADAGTLEDSNAVALPVDFLLDAFLYPMDLEGELYISSIDLTEQIIYLSDTVGNDVKGYAVYATGDTSASVIEYEAYDRQIGVLVFGDGANAIFQGELIRTFSAAATLFAPTAYTALNQVGVRGFLLPDGTLITGEVEFEGANGIAITTTDTSSGSPSGVLRIDVIGVAPVVPDDDCTDEGCTTDITEVCIERVAGSEFDATKIDDYTIALTTRTLTLDDICAASQRLRMPEINADGESGTLPPVEPDPCDTSVPVVPAVVVDTDDYTFCVAVKNSLLFLTTPSTPDYVNPIYIRALTQMGAADVPRYRQSSLAGSSDDLAPAVSRFVNSPQLPQGIELSFKGLAMYRSK